MYDYLLPIGTVVKVKEIKREVMIYGVLQRDFEKKEMLDYVAVPYPEGYSIDSLTITFNHDDIETVVYRGFEDDRRQIFLTAISSIRKDEKNG